jgi:hypothetical protein
MDASEAKRGGRAAPERIVNANRVTVALPFSRIELGTSHDELADLAALVQDLAEALAVMAGTEQCAELFGRARELSDRLGT